MGRKLFQEAGKRKYIWVLQVIQPEMTKWQWWSMYNTKSEARASAIFLEHGSSFPAYKTRILKYQLVKEG